ncbi:MAG: peptidyl-prolyl cis-trans isomerase [Algisphaera sp.]
MLLCHLFNLRKATLGPPLKRVMGAGVLAMGLVGCGVGMSPEAREAARPRPVVVRGGTPDGGSTGIALTSDDVVEANTGTLVAGLVGQIAGRPIYAHRVLEPLEAELAHLGQRQSRSVFRKQARELILRRIQGLVQDRLYLNEAERSLTPRERQNLDTFAMLQRRELVRRHGRGSEMLADRTLRAETGRTLEQTLRDNRDLLIVGTYRRREIEPLINVTRRDVERYYRDHNAQFNPPDTRTVRVIYTMRQANAEAVKTQLETGSRFVDVAADPALNGNRGGATLLTVEGDQSFGPEVAPALAVLEEGAWMGPVFTPASRRYYFIEVEALTRGDKQPLAEAQIEIERILRDQQRERLSRQGFDKLRRTASVTQEQQMADAVTRIAEARFATGG